MWILVDGGGKAVNLSMVWTAFRNGDAVDLWFGPGLTPVTLRGDDAKLAWKLLQIEGRRSVGVAEGHA